MYEAFYGFKEKPFSMLPDPGFLYLSKKHQAALTLLEYGLLNHVGFCVISGEPGAGKTTILRALLERTGDNVTVGLITNTHQSFGGLLDWVLSAFDLHRPNLTHVEMHQIFMEYLIEEYASGRTVLLIVDEAQNMKADALEELRMLSNVNSEKDQLMQVVLAGQPALKETLKLPDLMQFAQRVAVDYHLASLSLEETCGYIQHRLLTAGAQKDVFTPAACERIYNYSGGTPRLINLLCETVLVYGFADQQEMIDVDLVDEMVLERMKDSVVPIVNRDIAKQDNAEVSKKLEKDFPWIQPEGGTAGLKPDEDISPLAAVANEGQQNAREHVKPETVDTGAIADEQEKSSTTNTVDKVLPEIKQPSSTAADEVSAETKPPSSTPADVANKTYSRRADDRSGAANKDNETGKQLLKFGLLAIVLAAVLIALALVLDSDEQALTTGAGDDDAAEEVLLQQQQKQQRELEEKKLRQLQIEAETLKKERDAAIAKAEEEKTAKLEAEKKAAAQAAVAAKAAAEKRRLQEKKRIAAVKKRERQAKAAEAKARAEAKRARTEAARLEEQRRIMQIRLEEEQRLKEVEAARRLELEGQEKQRLEILAAEESAKQTALEAAAAEAAAKAKAVPVECTGQAARFKSGCR